jgi:hypothetical protein
LGIEFMRYGKAVMKLRQPAGTVEAHTTSLASTVSAAPDASDGPSIPVPGYQYTTHEHHHQLSHAHKSTSQDTDASDGGSSQQPAHALQAEAAGAQQQRLNLMERLEQVRFCCFCLPGAATQPHSGGGCLTPTSASCPWQVQCFPLMTSHDMLNRHHD